MEEYIDASKVAADVTDEEVQKFAKNEKFIHFAGMIMPARPGVRLFAVKLEYFHFEPGTPKNDEFILHVINWQGTSWAVTSIPKEYMELARNIAAEVGLRIADGVPHLMIVGQVCKFPMDSESVFTLENVPGHAVYKNDQNIEVDLLTQEDSVIEEIVEKHRSSIDN